MDLHMHSLFSVDGKSSIMEMADSAFHSGLKIICFTEHVDHHPRDTGVGFFRFDAYRDAIERAREAFAGRLEILMGIEFSEPNRYPAEFEQEQNRAYDMIMGSLHFSGKWFFGEKELLEENSIGDVFRRYYDDLYDMVDHGGFDVLAHIGFPQKYIGSHPMSEAAARALSVLLSSTGILPEINTSGFRTGYPHTMPDEAFLQIYRACSDGRVTVGSDAHRVGDPGQDLDRATTLVDELGLTPVVFRNRVPFYL